MANTSSYTITRDQVIQLALRKLGVLELGDTPDANAISNASMQLNLLMKQFATEGLKLWTIEEGVLPLVQNQTTYVLGGTVSDYFYNFTDPLKVAVKDKPLKVIQSFLRNTSVTPNVDIQVQTISKQEYNLLGSKYSTGITNSIFYDVRTTSGNMNVFLTPDSGTASDYELHFIYQRPIYDISKAQDNPDFPNEWLNTLVWSLADQLAIEYGVPSNQRAELAQRAALYREQLTSWDVEAASTFFQPSYQMAYQGYNTNSL